MSKRVRYSVLVSIVALCGTMCAQAPVQSDAFVDSVGINIHLGLTDSLYFNNFPLIKESLADLGIRHTRDALVDIPDSYYYDRHGQLGAMGITGLFVTDITESSAMLQSWPSRMASGAFDGYESPNEMDRYADNGLVRLRSFLPILYSAARTGRASTTAIVGPSLTLPASFATLGSISQYFDFGNLHTYFAGRNPGTPGWGPVDSTGHYLGSLPYALDHAKLDSGTKAIYLTETGYDMATGYINYVDENVASIYLPRLLMETWNAGIARTYLYELLTEQATQLEDFGLLRQDGSKRGEYYALKNLLNMLTDPGPTFTPSPLGYSLSGGDSYLHKLLLQKRNGTYYLALWIEKPSWDPDKHYRYKVPSENVTLALSPSFPTVTMHQWEEDGNLVDTSLNPSTTYSLNITDKMMILELQPFASEYSIGLTVSPVAGGSVTINPRPTTSTVAATNTFRTGTVVNLTATANPGYVFKGWSQHLSSTSGSINVTVSSNLSVTAGFDCVYTPSSSGTTFNASGGTATVGYISGDGCLAAPISSASWLKASATVNAVTLTASSNTGAARTATVSIGNASLVINQASTSPAGTINATLTTNYPGLFFYVDGVPYSSGTQMKWKVGDTHVFSPQALEVTPNGTVYFYKKWNGGLSGTGTAIVTVPGKDITYNADLEVGSYLIVSTAGNGTVSVSSPGIGVKGIPYYAPWEILKIVATPAPGCSFREWKGVSDTTATINYATLTSKVLIAAFVCTTASVKAN